MRALCRSDGNEIANQMTVSTYAASTGDLVRTQLPNLERFPCGIGSLPLTSSSGYNRWVLFSNVFTHWNKCLSDVHKLQCLLPLCENDKTIQQLRWHEWPTRGHDGGSGGRQLWPQCYRPARVLQSNRHNARWRCKVTRWAPSGGGSGVCPQRGRPSRGVQH